MNDSAGRVGCRWRFADFLIEHPTDLTLAPTPVGAVFFFLSSHPPPKRAGYPTVYRGSALSWSHGSMTAFGANTYTYNADGLRTSKITADGTYTYMWQGDTLLSVTHGAVTAYFYYHADGSPLGFRYVDSANRIDSFYTYVLGYAGDVEMIVDMDGRLVVNYSYDAWGNPGTPDINHPDYAANLPLNGVVTINPFRYRGYLYDSETGLYYLRSRYYDPATGRFISPDSIDYLNPTDFQGLNLYAYCENDPINRVDPTGHAWYDVLAWIGVGLVAASAIVLTAGMAGAVISGIAGGIIYGAAIGTIAVGTIGVAGGAVGGMIYDASKGNSFGTSIWTGTKIGFGIGAIAGAAIGGTIGGFASASVSGLTNAAFWTGLGPSGETIAGSAANSRGLITLGQTFGGKCAGFMTGKFGYGATRFLWASLSKTMASTVAMNSVTLFYGGVISNDSIFKLFEEPELIRRGIDIFKLLIGG